MARRVVFLGTPEFAVPCLAALAREHDVAATVTTPDKPSGRGLRLRPSSVRVESERLGIPCLTPDRVSAASFCDKLEKLEPDYLVVAAFGEILKPLVLAIPRVAPINVHASLLPRLRGAAPINWAIMRGEPATGVTTFVMDKGMDTGDILLQKEVQVGERETAGELAARLSRLAPTVLLETLRRMEAGTLAPAPQDDSLATYARRLQKADGVITWEAPAAEVDRFVRGVTPWPGAQTSFRGKRLRILAVRPAATAPGAEEPGTFVDVRSDSLLVAAGAGTAVLLEGIQPENRRPMGAQSFVAGYRPALGEKLGQ